MKYDTIVVGAGSAGSIVATRLSEDPDTSVLLLDEWSFEKLMPYFRKLETDTDFSDDFHGTDGPIIARRFKEDEWLPAQSAFNNACIAAGYPLSPDLNNPDSTGLSPVPFNNPKGIRWSTAIGYLGLSRHRLNLTIRPNCTTHRVIFEGKRAVGVEVESGGEKFAVSGDEIVLSAGAIGSPHTLMLSGVGPVAHLTEMGIPVVHDLPGFCQNLRDHPIVFVTWKTKPDVELDGVAPRTQLCLRYTADGSDLRNDMIIIMSSYATERRDTVASSMTMSLSGCRPRTIGHLASSIVIPSQMPPPHHHCY